MVMKRRQRVVAKKRRPGKKQQRGMALMARLLELQTETAKVEGELASLFGEPSTPRQRKAGSNNGNGGDDLSRRGAMTEAIREAVRAQRGEWTTNDIVAKAGVPPDRHNSAKAAVSRMLKAGEIEKGAGPGTYRAAK